MPPGELPTISEVLDQYHQAVLHNARVLAERTGWPTDECVSHVLPFQAHVAAATLNLLQYSQALNPTQALGGVIPLSAAEQGFE